MNAFFMNFGLIVSNFYASFWINVNLLYGYSVYSVFYIFSTVTRDAVSSDTF